jgi:predicted ester cyclase
MPNEELSQFYRRYVAAANERAFPAINDMIHDDVLINGIQRKRQDALNGLVEVTDAVPDFKWGIEDLFTKDTQIAARLLNSGTPIKKWLGLEPTGASVTFTEFACYRVRDGRFAEMWFLMDVKAVADQLNGPRAI